MPEKLFKLDCAYCHGETRLLIEVSPSVRGKKRKAIEITRYCEQCEKPNIIVVPENWDEGNLVLGDNDSFSGYDEDIPHIQGEKPA
jgi:hypothetical protein